MPNATPRASARPLPKSPPKPGSVESVRRKTAGLEEATALLKEARPLIERLEGERGLNEPNGQQPAAPTTRRAAPSAIVEATDALNGLVGELKGTQSAEQLAERDTFECAYFEWLRARAANHDPARPEDDETRNSLADDEREAQRELMLTPASLPWMVWQKLEVFELELGEEMRAGPRHDRFLMLAIGAIKTDMIRLGICDGISGPEGAVQ
jgi:hypothetical protein